MIYLAILIGFFLFMCCVVGAMVWMHNRRWGSVIRPRENATSDDSSWMYSSAMYGATSDAGANTSISTSHHAHHASSIDCGSGSHHGGSIDCGGGGSFGHH